MKIRNSEEAASDELLTHLRDIARSMMEPIRGHLKIRIIMDAKTRQAIDFFAIGAAHQFSV